MGSSDLMVGLLVVGGLIAAGWCFFMGPCKEWIGGGSAAYVDKDENYNQIAGSSDITKFRNAIFKGVRIPERREKAINLIMKEKGVSKKEANVMLNEFLMDADKASKKAGYARMSIG